MKSMSGFGEGRAVDGAVGATVHIRSVNGRFLKTQLKLPSALSGIEHEWEKRLKEKLHRGTVTVSVSFDGDTDSNIADVNVDAVKAYKEAFNKLGLPYDRIPTLPGVLVAPDATSDSPHVDLAKRAFGDALDALLEMRKAEGDNLHEHLQRIAKTLKEKKDAIERASEGTVQHYRDRMKERLDKLLADQSIDEASLAREVAILAERSDITEELERLQSHLQQLDDSIAQEQPIGRALEFLGQELLREVNTMGSKSIDAGVTQLAIEAKLEIERLKEQVANIE